MSRTALDEFAARLHKLPAKGETVNYGTVLATHLPAVLQHLDIPKDRTELTPQEAARVLATLSSELDDKSTRDAQGRVTNMSAREAFTIAFNDAMKADGDEKNPLKLRELEAKLQEETFQRNITNAQTGLASRPPNPSTPVWTIEKILGLVQVLAGGDINAVQRYMTDSAKPEPGIDPARLTPAMGKVDIEHPTIQAVSALTGDVVSRMQARLKTLDSRWNTETHQGPISQAAYDALTDEGAKAFFKDQPRLEIMLDGELNSPEFGEQAAARGLDSSQIEQLRASIRESIIGGETGLGTGRAVSIVNAHIGKLYVTGIDATVGELAARSFGARMADPAMNISPINQTVIRGLLNDRFYGESRSAGTAYVAGDFAWHMAQTAGFDMGEKVYSELYKPGTTTLNLNGFPEETTEFMKTVHDVTTAKMAEVAATTGGYFNPQAEITSGPHKGDIALRVLENLVAKELADKFRDNPKMREKMVNQMGVADDRDKFTKVSEPSEENFDIRKTFEGLRLDGAGKITGADGISIQLALPEGGIPLYNVNSAGYTADGKKVINYDVLDRVDFSDLKRITGEKPFSLSFLAERDGEHAAGWFLKTQDGQNKIYLGLGREAGMDETGLSDAVKLTRGQDPVANTGREARATYQTAMQDKPWLNGDIGGQPGMRIGL